MTERSGKIQTVCGLMDPSDLGITMTHEHLHMTFNVSYVPAEREADMEKTHIPLKLDTIGWIRQNPYSNRPNLLLDDEDETLIEELKFYKKNGGCSLVENTILGIDRDIKKSKMYAEASGVNIIQGTGYYVGACHPPEMNTMSIEELTQFMVNDIEKGADGTDIKCGVIGEIGCSWPLQANEKKVLQASAAAQAATGCPVIIHPGRNPIAPTDILRILGEAGGDTTKTVMSHLDRTIFDKETLAEFAKQGSYLEFDLFGIETSHYQMNHDVDMPSDAQRIQYIKFLIEEGYNDKVVIAHDVHTKHRLMKYGGHGYSHILLNVVPKMLKRGISQEQVDKILIENPKKWLTFK
ncbi:N-acetyltaurine hydrolase-like [Ptychodera flava]|uniref:N-acetyltaurine hydrolase-like n=1 Tax=Ptychodera flava TaxID=63121 RepID=UPI00396A3B9E